MLWNTQLYGNKIFELKFMTVSGSNKIYLNVQKSAFAALKNGGSVLTLVGLAPLSEEVPFNTFQFIMGRTVNGTYFGGMSLQDTHYPNT